jgi:glutaredoxin-related protein
LASLDLQYKIIFISGDAYYKSFMKKNESTMEYSKRKKNEQTGIPT